MSLMLLVVIVVAGIAAVVAAVHLTGGSVPARLGGEGEARERFGRDFPDLRIRSVHLTRDGDAAFAALADGRVGVVQALGGKFLTRVIATGDLAGRPRVNDATLLMRFRDYTWPGGAFVFASNEDALAVEALFAGLRRLGRWEER